VTKVIVSGEVIVRIGGEVVVPDVLWVILIFLARSSRLLAHCGLRG
jgi:hypothetical protein